MRTPTNTPQNPAKTTKGTGNRVKSHSVKISNRKDLNQQPSNRLARLDAIANSKTHSSPKVKNSTGLPDNLKSGIENLSGHSLDDVKVHYNSSKPASLGAHAYAQGTNIHISSGQKKHLPHEAWHVVQQKQGRVKPTMQLHDMVNVNDDHGLENEADVMGGKALQMKSNDHVQLQTNPITSPAIVQRNKHKKRLKNVLTLGIRKAYVKKKRANREAALAAQQEQEPVATPGDQFVEAYNRSRYYHHTGNPGNLPSMEQHGLLNYEDRPRVLGHQVYGMSRLGGEFEGDEKKGVFLGNRQLVESNEGMRSNLTRAFLPRERTQIHNASEEHETPPHEMFRDDKFRGGGHITKNSIPANLVTAEKTSDLLGEGNPKLPHMLDAIGSQYEGGAPDHEQMKAHWQQAIRERRLSDAAMDNFDRHTK